MKNEVEVILQVSEGKYLGYFLRSARNCIRKLQHMEAIGSLNGVQGIYFHSNTEEEMRILRRACYIFGLPVLKLLPFEKISYVLLIQKRCDSSASDRFYDEITRETLAV